MISFLCGLAGIKATIFMPFYQFLGVQPTAIATPRMGMALGIKIFPCSVLGPVMTRNEFDMLTILLKIKPLTFIGSKIEDVFDFIVYCFEGLYKMGIIEHHDNEFVIFQLQSNDEK